MSRDYEDPTAFERWRNDNSDLWDYHYLDRPLPQPVLDWTKEKKT